MRQQVEWREYASDHELTRLYGSARVFAFLSTYEGFAMTPQMNTTTTAAASSERGKKGPAFDVYTESQVAPDAVARGNGTPAPPAVAPGTASPDDEDYGAPPRRYYRDEPPPRGGNPVGNAARSVGRTIRRLLPF